MTRSPRRAPATLALASPPDDDRDGTADLTGLRSLTVIGW